MVRGPRRRRGPTLYFGIQSWGRGFMPAGLMAALSLIAAALFVGLSPLRLRRRRV